MKGNTVMAESILGYSPYSHASSQLSIACSQGSVPPRTPVAPETSQQSRGPSDPAPRPAPYHPYSTARSLAHRGPRHLQKQPPAAVDPQADLVLDPRDVNA